MSPQKWWNEKCFLSPLSDDDEVMIMWCWWWNDDDVLSLTSSIEALSLSRNDENDNGLVVVCVTSAMKMIIEWRNLSPHSLYILSLLSLKWYFPLHLSRTSLVTVRTLKMIMTHGGEMIMSWCRDAPPPALMQCGRNDNGLRNDDVSLRCSLVISEMIEK